MEWVPNISASSLVAWDVHFLEVVGAIPGTISPLFNILGKYYSNTPLFCAPPKEKETPRQKFRNSNLI
jgi:hypothetical protein